MEVELLAPAGSYESMQAALQAGADAIYIGGNKFGARAFANNPDQDRLLEAIDYVHLHGKKIYLTVNTLLKESELNEELYDYLNPYYTHGLDAVIVQDMGVLTFVKENFPQIPIHASTQMTVTGADGARFLEKQGVTRVVTSRELSLTEIKEIREGTSLEIESFVHGALCYSYSGQCLYSSLIGGRSGNRGRCAQPCRLPYDVMKDNKKVNKSNESYVLSPKDICTIDIIPDLIESGITSLKIEGRMKRPEYTAGVVHIYRKYLDHYLRYGRKGYHVLEDDRNKLMDLYNRGGFSKGYYVERNGPKMMSLTRPNHFGTVAAKVVAVNKGKLQIMTLVELHKGDILELITKGSKKKYDYTCPGTIKENECISIELYEPHNYRVGQSVFRTKNEKLLESLRSNYVDRKNQEKINGKLIFYKDFPVILETYYEDIVVNETGDIPFIAQNQPITREKLHKQMSKTGNTPFIFDSLEIDMEEGLFLPMQSMNELRRRTLEELERQVLHKYRRTNPSMRDSFETCEFTGINDLFIDYKSMSKQETKQESENSCTIKSKGYNHINIYLECIDYLQEILCIPEIHTVYIDCNGVTYPYGDGDLKAVINQYGQSHQKFFFVFPHIFRMDTAKDFEKKWNEFLAMDYDGVMVTNLEGYEFLSRMGYQSPIVPEHNMYTFNNKARHFWKQQGVAYDTLPIELNYKELRERGCLDSELIVYGYLPMMVSAQCVNKTVKGCTHHLNPLYLKDRYNKLFYVKNNCKYCYNTIYNCEPLVLLDQYKEIVSLHPGSIRLNFTKEDSKQAIQIIKSFVSRFINGNDVRYSLDNFTRGHFKRGIE